jgi:hypothetical protein
MSGDTQKYLYELYRDDIKETERLTGLDLSEWVR